MTEVSQPNTLVSTYAGAPSGRRYDAWREEVCRGFCRVDAQPSDGELIDCKLEIAQLSSLAWASASGTSAQFSRTRDLLSDACDALVLVTATSGRVLVTQNGRPIELLQSEMCLTDMSVLGTITLCDDGRFTTTRIPRSNLLSICPKAESRLSEPLREQAALRETIARYSALAAAMAGRLDVVAQRVTARHVVDLVGLLWGTGPDERELIRQRGLSAAQLQLIQADVLENLGDGTLTVAAVAKRCGVSPRHVQRLFEQVGTTFTEFMLEQKLLLARKLLFSPGNCHAKISAIAYAAGFGDLSYFNRTFRRRFGLTPSELRDDHRPFDDERRGARWLTEV